MNNFSHGNGQLTSKIFVIQSHWWHASVNPSINSMTTEKNRLGTRIFSQRQFTWVFLENKKFLNIFLAPLSPPGPSEVSTWYFSSVLCPSLLLILSLLQRSTHFYGPFPPQWGKEEVFPLHRSIPTLHSILGKKKTTFLRVISSTHHRQNMF